MYRYDTIVRPLQASGKARVTETKQKASLEHQVRGRFATTCKWSSLLYLFITACCNAVASHYTSSTRTCGVLKQGYRSRSPHPYSAVLLWISSIFGASDLASTSSSREGVRTCRRSDCAVCIAEGSSPLSILSAIQPARAIDTSLRLLADILSAVLALDLPLHNIVATRPAIGHCDDPQTQSY